ncbi:InlB B-repeat-containing protein [Bacteroides ovatus]|uniref:InlB B-repeat-containing protein n=1 Tax=Bacteroides ovatus TaxID=28116 RepID=UPI001E51BDB6|nr:leucine-rich repeat domain-containing protein [Bacteroides ovatus]
MKRLSFLLMAVVCVIFFSCGEDEDKQVHSITAFAGYGGAIATADKEIAVAGEAITVTATPAEGFLFKEWKIRVGNTVIENVQANPSTFTMPMEDVVIVATFMIRNDVLERITDPALKAYCQSRMDTEQEIDGVTYPKWDTNGNGVLSPDEASAVKAIDITGGVNGVKIKSVNELTEFTGLEVFKIGGNELATLNVVWSQLAKLDCSHNELTDLSVGGSGKLKELYCNNNHLSSLKLKTMVYENGYNMLHCGNQVTEEGEVQILEAIMTDEQISFWESNLKNLSENANVDTKTMPAADVHLTLTKAVKYQFGNLMLILRDDNGNSVQVTLKSTELKPGEYSKDQMSSAYVTISGGGSYRNLDSDDPGSFTVKYDEGTGIYIIEGVLILQPNASYPSVNVVRFEYVGAI